MSHEPATTECLDAIQIFCGGLRQYDSYSGMDSAKESNGSKSRAKLDDLKNSVEDLRLTMQSPSSSPAVLKNAIAAMTEEHAKSSEYANSLAHIYRLPTEILIIIFKLAGHASQDPNFPCTYDVRPSELDISHVSRRWRDIAINNPSLWTKWGEYVTRSNNLLSIYFHRSSNLKVEVELNSWKAQTQMSVFQACASKGRVGKYHVASELLEISMHRFRSLAISSITTSMAELLKRIALTASSSPTPSFASLACLSINANFIEILHEQDTLLNFQEFRNILSASPNLAVLQLADAVVSCSEIMDPAGTEFIDMPSLTQLCLDAVDEPSDLYSISILAALKAPNLRHCRHIFPHEDGDKLRYTFFQSDGTPRFSSVQALSLNTSGTCDDDSIFMDDDIFFEIIVKAFPSVTDVTLVNTDVMQCGWALAERGIRRHPADAWPCIQRLSLYRPSHKGLRSIHTWLNARSLRIRQPRRLSFKVSGPISNLSKGDVLCLKEMEIYGDLTLENIDLETLQKFEEDSLNVDEEEIT
ncbi:hypothetical protein BJ138DRAFT_1098046 [Hygrophoropsis aurantiaca]|uniref:Uncharacterized protein n=1 Tax=Hygrophoropsis aurantiaca TaxID=72124 RepID=A0ACB8AQG4_9AGAM|nr:hypothetical protein BJ138DRAFT_1098046 [Hygrophoropsis aurantiaca]